MNNRKQIVTLIESEIVNSKLVFTLNKIGIDASDYLTDISQVIFIQIGIRKENQTEELYKRYFTLIKQVDYLDLRIRGEKEKLISKIYDFLIANV